MFIWRPIIEGKVSVADVKNGEVDIIDLLKLNSFIDYDQAARFVASKEKPR